MRTHLLLLNFVREGRLKVVYDDGRMRLYGDGAEAEVVVRLTRAGERGIARDPGLGFGEAYMDGDLVVEGGDLWPLMDLIGRNLRHRAEPTPNPFIRLCRALQRRIEQANDPARSRRNVHRHYDLSLDLYRRFLDADLQYSCAYFPGPGMTLEEAQSAKKAHLAAKLRLRPGLRVLDIGCGWGGLGLTLASEYGVDVTGITLSDEQLATANARAAELGLSGRARFALADYRETRGRFDRIVSVGMFEHVGAPNYRAFFERVEDLLVDDGVALIHSIGRMGPPNLTSAFIGKYIFPGGYVPSLSEITGAVEYAGLWVTDIEILRQHYAETLSHWRARFATQRPTIGAIYDERFCRMWEFYLALSELSFRAGGHMVAQVQLARRQDALPITRDYMFETERAQPEAARAKRASGAARR